MHIHEEDGMVHVHEHTHADGTTHSHPHTHEHAEDLENTGTVMHSHDHDEEHCHSHDHGHPHDHTHTHDHAHEAPKDLAQVKAVMKYMVDHNEHHAEELADLLGLLPENAKAQLTRAIGSFEAANVELSCVLDILEKEE